MNPPHHGAAVPPPAYFQQLAQFMLGMQQNVPIRPQDMAVAQVNHALNGRHGAIMPPAPEMAVGVNVVVPRQAQPVAQAPQQEQVVSRKLDVHIPCPGARKGESVLRIVTFDIDDTEPGDFLSRVCANMDIKVEGAKLGWKSCDDKKGALFRQLETKDDVTRAFTDLGRMLDSKRRERPVYMVVENLAREPEPEKAPKPTEAAIDPEVLTAVKTKLTCAKHPGANRWCYVRNDEGHEGEHVRLGINEVGLWARAVQNKRANADCLVPPDNITIAELPKADARSVLRSQRASMVPDVHVHVDANLIESRIAKIAKLDADFPKMMETMKRKHGSTGNDEDSDEDVDDSEPVPISALLHELHAKTPTLNFPGYQAALEKHGICYEHTILKFKLEYYQKTVGLVDGAAVELYDAVKRRARKAKKARQANKEN
ncbi:hypothetical protein ONZ45_g18153 [Pleurotus djamor]|nr:hypothetical protein ONZ45_g18153 [Pleurotus djamor]